MKQLHFRLSATGYVIEVILVLCKDEGIMHVVDFLGSPLEVDYEAIDEWIMDSLKMFYEYHDHLRNPSYRQIHNALSKAIIELVKQAFSKGCE